MGDAGRALRSSVGLAAVWMLAAAVGVFEPVERLTVRARYLLRWPAGFTSPIRVVAIDEASLAKFGQMPWPRETFARVIERVAAGGAAVVAIDVAFNEPGQDPAADRRLAAAIRRVPTVLPAFAAYSAAGGSRVAVIQPTPVLREAAVATGSVQLSSYQQAEPWEFEPVQDPLGAPGQAGRTGERLAALPLLVARAFQGEAWEPAYPGGIWQDRPLLLDYRGPTGTVPMISAAELLSGPAVPAGLRGAIVLVGATATGQPDTNFTAPDLRAGPMSGVETMSNAIDNLLTGRFFKRLGGPALALLLLLLALGPGRMMLAGVAPGGRRHLVWAGATLGWLALAVAAFPAGIWLDVVPVLGFFFTCHFLGLLGERQALLESRNRLLERYARDLAGEAQRQRERVEGELHDGVQQLLVALGRELRQVRKAIAGVPAAARAGTGGLGDGHPGGSSGAGPVDPTARALARLEQAEALTEDVRAEVMRVRADLLPPGLRHDGLAGALPVLVHEMARRHGFTAIAEVGEWTPLPQETEVEVYWLVQEALNNVAKHAQATTVTVRLHREGATAVVDVQDDGLGFTPPDLATPPTGLAHSGLHRMWLRMRGRGGDLTLTSHPGRGARLRFALPVAAPAERPLP